MPLIYISIRAGKLEPYKRTIFEGLCRTMRETFNVPEETTEVMKPFRPLVRPKARSGEFQRHTWCRSRSHGCKQRAVSSDCGDRVPATGASSHGSATAICVTSA
jgi:hypothetical protein